MTTIKATSKKRTILDFNKPKYSKNYIHNAIRNCELIAVEQKENPNEFTIYTNEIKIGIYTIILELPCDSSTNWNKLADYGDFQVSIVDNTHSTKEINLKTDYRFAEQPWIKNNFFGKLYTKHLVDIIFHCIRLNRLTCFI